MIVTHLSFIMGDQGIDEYDSTIDIDADDVLIDHCTAVSSTEENIGIPTTVTRSSIINTVIAEGLFDHDLHDDLRARGLLINSENSSDIVNIGCLYAHNNRRHPLARGELLIANNYIYNYTHKPEEGSGGSGNIIPCLDNPTITAKGLHFREGAGTPSDYDREIFSHGGYLYAADIERPDRHPLTDGSFTMLNSPPIVPSGLDMENDIHPSEGVPEYVCANTGPRPANRPPYEDDLITNRLQEPYDLIDSQNDVGGYPDYTPTSRTLDIPSTGIVDWIKSEYTALAEGTK